MNFPKYPVILMPEAKNQQDLDDTLDPEDLGPYWTESFSHVFYWVFPLWLGVYTLAKNLG